jgi:hypothetical protein
MTRPSEEILGEPGTDDQASVDRTSCVPATTVDGLTIEEWRAEYFRRHQDAADHCLRALLAESDRDLLRAALSNSERCLTMALGVIVEFGDLNGFRNLSDQELGRTVHQMAVYASDALDEVRAALARVDATPVSTPQPVVAASAADDKPGRDQ